MRMRKDTKRKLKNGQNQLNQTTIMLHSQQYTERKNRIKAKNDVRTDIILLAIVFIIVLNVSRIDNTLK